jgi:hypothetical protein
VERGRGDTKPNLLIAFPGFWPLGVDSREENSTKSQGRTHTSPFLNVTTKPPAVTPHRRYARKGRVVSEVMSPGRRLACRTTTCSTTHGGVVNRARQRSARHPRLPGNRFRGEHVSTHRKFQLRDPSIRWCAGKRAPPPEHRYARTCIRQTFGAGGQRILKGNYHMLKMFSCSSVHMQFCRFDPDPMITSVFSLTPS